ncbi:MAG TPA: Swarming motility protein ybiA [Cyanobacteria bacterium UBA11149]|nr:Swarming motility protein ybiA [Cyanobacteria bacterium UBA11367]HBE59602.1 Swarming motility protein ybiA [Cyanobacteria bacterium UBA11366]HBK65144.1 Swarming motility protein ybiA [Cyanobacteria bacterium UBA11166]HBR75441.1 Swarming motility protein ybiA [Cyanobacteria bacterium UBA11159]HBS70017.1 Swarming motility protein ybiA [Cyanobacteria bacterium UBA11153]HBW91994.1 Swarming motility protein ybiA [Cyanobacteria bacterium UBA11149]HCA94126.1 Swarming motility protein ybiA [Cyanob
MTIYFFTADEKPYGCFCNFSLHGFELDGLWWPTSEHYYQAQKFAGTPHAEIIRLAKTPGESAKLGHALPHRSDWKRIKYNVMHQAVFRKFQTHEDIRKILLSTGDKMIIQKDIGDYYWGCGKDGTGHNYLGKILMEVRISLRHISYDDLVDQKRANFKHSAN